MGDASALISSCEGTGCMGNSAWDTAQGVFSPILAGANAGVAKLERALTIITVLSGIAALVSTVNLLKK